LRHVVPQLLPGFDAMVEEITTMRRFGSNVARRIGLDALSCFRMIYE